MIRTIVVLVTAAAAIEAPGAAILFGATILSAAYIGKCFLSLLD